MKLLPALVLLLTIAFPAAAQVLPEPGDRNPRLQTIRWAPDAEVLLTALPGTGLTVMLEPGEQIRRATIGDGSAYDVRVSAERDSFLILPLGSDPKSSLIVETDRREYRFQLVTGDGLVAAYLVRFEYGNEQSFDQLPASAIQQPEPLAVARNYKVRGDREVRPAAITDDGVRTRIEFGPRQLLPAIFAIGPSGDEQVVNGYMRGDIYVIDQVHDELVFRIDKEKATAQRLDEGGKRK